MRILYNAQLTTSRYPYGTPGSFTTYNENNFASCYSNYTQSSSHIMVDNDKLLAAEADQTITYPYEANRTLRYRQTTIISNSGKNGELQIVPYNFSDRADPMRRLIGQFVNVSIMVTVQLLGGSTRSKLPEWDFVSSGMFSYLQYDWLDCPSKSTPDTQFTSVLNAHGILGAVTEDKQIQWGTLYIDFNSNNSTSVAFTSTVSMAITGMDGVTRVL